MRETSISLLSHLSATAASSVFTTGWQTPFLVASVSLYLRALPRSTPAVRHSVWAVLLAVAGLLPLLGIAFGRLAVSSSATGTGAIVHLDSRWSLAIAGLWLCLSLARALQLGQDALRIRAIAHSAVPVVADGVETTCFTTDGRRRATLCTTDSDLITQPSVIGFRSPRVLIPAWMYSGLSSAELTQIVLHEMEHLRRRDDWINLAQKLSIVLFPLNPALLWVERTLCTERELACDEGVLQATSAPKIYASCLVRLAEQRLLVRQMPLALGAWARRSDLARRIEHILDRRSPSVPRRQSGAAVISLVLGLLAGTAVLSRTPQMISFGPSAALASETSSAANASPLPVPIVHSVSLRGTSAGGAPHATLLKAVLPASAPVLVRAVVRTHRRTSAARQTRSRRYPQRPPIMVTSWPFASTPRLVLAIASHTANQTQFSQSYAAVPTEAGWLFFQL